jgi:hypothetical protein
MDKSLSELQEEKARLEGTVVALMRQNQKLSDELDTKGGGSISPRAPQEEDSSLNVSLADELDSVVEAAPSTGPSAAAGKSESCVVVCHLLGSP